MNSKIKINRDNGFTEYWHNGAYHREDGPALISSDGTRERWYLKGEWYTNTRQFCEDANINDEESVIMILKHGESLLNPLDRMDYETYQCMLEITNEITNEINNDIIASIMELAKKDQDSP